MSEAGSTTFQGGKQTRGEVAETDGQCYETEVREHRKAESWLDIRKEKERQLMGRIDNLLFILFLVSEARRKSG